MSVENDRRLRRFVDRMVVEKMFSALVLSGTANGKTYTLSGGGCEVDSLFDLASLTKPIVATAALWLASRRMLDLVQPVLPSVAGAEGRNRGPVTTSDLLRHLSGAVAWRPLYSPDEWDQQGSLTDALLNPSYWGHARGVYSDIGYLTASRWLEAVSGGSLWGLISECVEQLGLDLKAGFDLVPAPVEGATLARTVHCDIDTDKELELAAALGVVAERQGKPDLGCVQDGNARMVCNSHNLLAGHAGLFGTAQSLLRLGEFWLRRRGRDDSLSRLLEDALVPVNGRVLGWFRSEPIGELTLGFHHTGFTGGYLLVEPEAGAVAVMLGHRLDPSSDLGSVRRSYRQLALGALS